METCCSYCWSNSLLGIYVSNCCLFAHSTRCYSCLEESISFRLTFFLIFCYCLFSIMFFKINKYIYFLTLNLFFYCWHCLIFYYILFHFKSKLGSILILFSFDLDPGHEKNNNSFKFSKLIPLKKPTNKILIQSLRYLNSNYLKK